MKYDLFEYILERRKKWFLLFLAIGLFVFYQVDNVSRTDDEYLGEQVYWLLHEGKVKSELGYCDLQYDRYQSIFHKLFIYTGYGFSRLFGWSLYTLHAVSLCCFLLFLLIFYRHTKNTGHYYIIALTLLLFNQDLLYAAGNFRPEVMILMLGFLSYTLLCRYINQHRYQSLVLSAVCAGLCMLAHLNGVIYIAAGCLLLLSGKKLIDALVYGIIALAIFSFYFADILYHADLSYFWAQFTHDPILHHQTRHWYDPLLRLLQEHSRFFFTEKQIILSITLLAILWFSYKRLKHDHSHLLTYTLVLVIGLGLVCPSKSTKYMVLYLPFLYLILVNGWRYLEEKKKSMPLLLTRSLLAAGILVSIGYSTKHIYNNIVNLQSGGMVHEYEMLTGKIKTPLNTVDILAPRTMVFNQLGHFNNLWDIELVAKENLQRYLQGSSVDYVVFSERDRSYFNVSRLLKEADSPLSLVDSTQHYILAKVQRKTIRYLFPPSRSIPALAFWSGEDL